MMALFSRELYPTLGLPQRAGPGLATPSPNCPSRDHLFQDFVQDDPEAGARRGSALWRQSRAEFPGPCLVPGSPLPAVVPTTTSDEGFVGHGNSIHDASTPVAVVLAALAAVVAAASAVTDRWRPCCPLSPSLHLSTVSGREADRGQPSCPPWSRHSPMEVSTHRWRFRRARELNPHWILLALALPEQLRQPRDVDGDASRRCGPACISKAASAGRSPL
jgi:hypothetical protein